MEQALSWLSVFRTFVIPGSNWQQSMKRLQAIPLLNKETENDLAVLANQGVAACKQLEQLVEHYDSIAAIPRTKADPEQLRQQIITGEEARLRLVFHNLRFAAWVARHSMGWNQASDDEFVRELTPSSGGRKLVQELKRFAHDRLRIEDRFQVLVISLYESAERFQAGGKAKFITYAAYQLARDLARAVIAERFRDTLTASPAEGLVRLRATQRKLRRLTGFEPGAAELMADTGLGSEALDRRYEEDWLMPEMSLEDIDASGSWVDPASQEPLTITDLLYDEHDCDPAEIACLSRMDEGIVEVLETLSEREAGVIRLRFGLVDGHPRTLDEIGMVYGLTRGRISQIEHKTMSKLRHPMRSQVLREYLPGVPSEPSEFRNPYELGRRKVTVASHPERYDLDRHPWLKSKLKPT
jgi:RNA polymerase sigma factor (sigma-70 family)